MLRILLGALVSFGVAAFAGWQVFLAAPAVAGEWAIYIRAVAGILAGAIAFQVCWFITVAATAAKTMGGEF